jgi:hypothetical protein
MPVGHLQLYLGPRSEHNTYEAETVGGILGTWIAVNSTETRGKVISLYTDNQALVTAVSKRGKG